MAGNTIAIRGYSLRRLVFGNIAGSYYAKNRINYYTMHVQDR